MNRGDVKKKLTSLAGMSAKGGGDKTLEAGGEEGLKAKGFRKRSTKKS